MGKDASRRLSRGGVWDKLGNRFESRWTVKALTELLDGRADSICLEPPSEEGFEFTFRHADRTEYHQCKRQLASTSDWSLDDLVPVLVAFGAKLQADSQTVCVFASTVSATTLANLQLRAKLAPTAADFDGQLADKWRPPLRHLARLWQSAGVAETWNLLRRVRVETISEDLLVVLNEARLRIQVGSQQAASVASMLFEYVYEHTTEEVTGDSLWTELSRAGIRRLELGDGMRSRVEVLRRGFRERLQELAIPGVALYRPESSVIVGALESGHKTVLLVGDAGAGKSHVLAEVAVESDRRHWPWLPINLDGLPSATSSLQLGQHLGLSESPADVTAQLAGDRRILFVDQLDAISATSGRQLNSYDGIRELLADAHAHDGIQLVVACRRFDLDSDDRLRALLQRAQAFEVPLEPLDGNEVRRIVEELGLDATKLRDPQLALLASPLHLYLLSQLRGEVEADQFDFSTQDDLYRLFWQRKQQDTNRKLGQPANWTDVIDVLIEHLNRNRRLWAPMEVLDHEAATAQAMASEHVLVIRDGRISFFHETFFDYAFARRFSTAQPEGLVSFLLAHDQELFRRAQVRSVLVHLRRIDLIRYLDNITAILTDARVRFHIKHVVASLLANLDDPTDDEWERLEPLLQGPRTSISDRLVRMVRDAPAWQEYLLERGWIEEQLGGDADAQVRGVNVAMSLQRRRPELIAPILLRHVGDGGSWRTVLRAIVGYGGELGADRSYFEAVLRLIDNGVLDEPYCGPFRRDLWSLGYGLAEAKPDWACEYVAHVLRRAIVTSPEGERSPFSMADSTGDRAGELILNGAAERAPVAFAQQLVPLMLDLMARFPAELRPGQRLRRDTVWRLRALGTPYGTSATLLRGMEVALRAIVRSQEFDSLRDQLATSGYETANFLLTRAYAAAGPERAAEAARFLVDLPERLELSLDGNRGTAAAEVIRAASPNAPIKVHRDLVALVLGYLPGADDEDAATRRDYLQFRLLAAVLARRLGSAARRRLAELRKRFNMLAPPNPVDDDDQDGWSAIPPVPRDQLDNLADADWISLMVANRAPEYWTQEARLRGGADDLANVFEQEFEQDPTRFAAVLLRLPDEANSSYFEAGLRAAAKKVENLDDETVWAIARKCHRLDGRPSGRWLTWMIKATASRALPDEVVDMIEWYAIEDPDPIDDRAADSVVFSPQGPRLLESGINTTRGSAAEAITALLHFHNDLRARLLPAVRHLASDPVAAVRTCAAQVLNVLVRSDPDAAFELLPALVMPDLRVAGTVYCRRLFMTMARIDYSRIAPLLDTLATCGNDEAEYTAGMALALHSLLAGDGRVGFSAHPAAVRHGVAAVYSANLSIPSYSAQCSAELIQLFSDSDERVREAAAGCFHQLPATQLIANRELCIAFAGSLAYRRHSHFLLRRIANTPGVPVDVVVEAANQFIRQAGSAAGDIREAAAADASDVSVLLIRAYSQNPSPDVRAHALDAIDQMLEAGAFGVEESIESYRR